MILINIVILLCTLLVNADVIVMPPAIQRHDPGNNVRLLWTLSDVFDVSSPGALMNIYKGDSVGDQNILTYQLDPTGPICNNYVNDPRLNCTTEGTQVGFSLSGVNSSDASNYTILVRLTSFPEVVGTDSNGLIYVYGKPTAGPIVPPLPEAEERSDIDLQCQSESTSEPEAYRPDVISTRWYRDSTDITDSPPDRHTIVGPKLSISNVQSSDGDVSYSCTGEEGGAVSDVSPSVSINVLCK